MTLARPVFCTFQYLISSCNKCYYRCHWILAKPEHQTRTRSHLNQIINWWPRTSQFQTFVVSRGFDGFTQFFFLIFTKLCILFENKKKKFGVRGTLSETMLFSVQYAFLGNLRVHLRVTLSTHTHIVFYLVKKSQYDKDFCGIELHSLQDLRPAVLSQRLFSILWTRFEVHYLQSVICSP